MSDEADAKTRLLVITAVRLASAALIGVGMAIVAGKIDIPRPAGIAFIVFGLLELLLLPPFLIRKWKSPER
ncbi:MAG: hypothetical protein ABL914_13685 [Novosphingobium sp.]|uniref:hypothetical protein n=1 Tax=Novosphingobium sp. TaxID=1874826 RepID=UPI0032BB8687